MLSLIKTGFQTIKKAFAKTGSFLRRELKALFIKPLDDETLENLERVLYEADLGSSLVEEFLSCIKQFHKEHPKARPEEYLLLLQKRSEEILQAPPINLSRTPPKGSPKVIFIVGVNGSGKTTSLAKLANLLQKENEKVLVAAGDTFRAAAIEQIELWTKKIGVDLVKTKIGSDSSGVLYDSLMKAKAKEYSALLVDTAGRLESKTDLMHELEKLKRTAQKFDQTAPHEIYLTLDSTLGQAALEQARIFHKFTPLTGIILTKIDGSAKGGIALSIYQELKIPIRFVTFGETLDDIALFDAESYAKALFSEN
jgi:fused signal recognition particle receptor